MSRAHKTIFEPKNKHKYKGAYPITARSSWELAVFNKFDAHPNIILWAVESVKIPYINPLTGRYSMYIPDILVVYRDKKNKLHSEIIEIKPAKEAVLEKAKSRKDKENLSVNLAKWKSAQRWCKKNNFAFRVLTEEHLFVNYNKK